VQGLLPAPGHYAGWAQHSHSGERRPALILITGHSSPEPDPGVELQMAGYEGDGISPTESSQITFEFSYPY
jgi:hypothetical protein